MAGQLVLSAATLTAGIRADFARTYANKNKGVEQKLGPIMTLKMSSDKLIELYAYYESAPHPKIWPRGTDLPVKNFRSIGYNVENFDWSIGVEWHKNDRADDQTRTLFDQARQAGANFGLLTERIFFQFILATTDSDLLATIPNAPDGAVLYATTAGGSDRFGATDGNLLSGSGVATSDDVRTDYFSAVAQFDLFQDTEGQPLWDPSDVERGTTVIYGASNRKVFADAFQQGRTLEGGAALTNIIMDSGQKVTLMSTPRITDDDWFVFMNDLEVKPIFEQLRQGLQTWDQLMSNSDRARNTKQEGVQWDARMGYGISIPYGTVKINN